MKSRNGGNGFGEGRDEDGAGELGFVEHVVGLRENAKRGSHVSRTADAAIVERVLIGGEREWLRESGRGERAYADPVVVVFPVEGAKGGVFFGVGNAIQIDQIVQVARFLRLRNMRTTMVGTFVSFGASGCCVLSDEGWLAGRETGISGMSAMKKVYPSRSR